jgi:hypothetical protein
VQKLTGRLAALNRFIVRSAEKGLPLFRTLRSLDHFEWGPEQQQAFDELKTYLTKLTTLSKPSPSATLLLYLAASPTTVSAVLIEEKEHENKMKQFLIYFISEALSGAKLNYSELVKNSIYSGHGIKEAQALFLSSSHQSAFGTATGSTVLQ